MLSSANMDRVSQILSSEVGGTGGARAGTAWAQLFISLLRPESEECVDVFKRAHFQMIHEQGMRIKVREIL